MKSFKEYAKQTENTAEKTESIESVQTEQDAQTTAKAEDLTQRIARMYNGKSNAAMLKSILVEAEKSKRAGTLSNAEIEAFYQTFSPMLDGAQKRKLRAVVDKLKEI